MRIASAQYKDYRHGIIDWLKNSNIRRLQLAKGQKLKSVTVWWIGDQSPDPKVGGKPKIIERFVVAEWPKRE